MSLAPGSVDLVAMFEHELHLCRVKCGETVLVFTDPRFPHPEYPPAAFAAARSLGSDYNDPIVMKDGRIGTRTNRSGGTLAGITTGEDIWFQFAVKPTPSVAMAQETVDLDSRSETTIRCNGHFDTNITPRVAVIAEAMAWLTVMDQSLAAGLVHPTCFDKSPFLESKPNP